MNDPTAVRKAKRQILLIKLPLRESPEEPGHAILEYVDRLDELDTKDVAPMAQVSDRFGVDPNKAGSARFAYARRDDIPEGLRKSLAPETALKGAPETDGTFFEVPKVIEK